MVLQEVRSSVFDSFYLPSLNGFRFFSIILFLGEPMLRSYVARNDKRGPCTRVHLVCTRTVSLTSPGVFFAFRGMIHYSASSTLLSIERSTRSILRSTTSAALTSKHNYGKIPENVATFAISWKILETGKSGGGPARAEPPWAGTGQPGAARGTAGPVSRQRPLGNVL